MKHTLLGAAGFALAAALAPAAHATAFTAADMSIVTNVDGTISAKFGNSGIAVGEFTDTFSFTIDLDGTGSGSVTTSTSDFHKPTDVKFLEVLVNGIPTDLNTPFDKLVETAGIAGVPIASGIMNVITIHGYSYGNGSYGGNATFVPGAVPEAATWAMMLVGFGFAGAGMRASRRKVAFG